MAAQFLRLRLQLLVNSFSVRPRRIVFLLCALTLGVACCWLVVGQLVALRSAGIPNAAFGVAIIGSLVTLAYIIVPLLVSTDDAMDPRRFALLGIPDRTLARGLALAALLGLPSLLVVVLSGAQVVTWSAHLGTMVVALFSCVGIIATCVLSARVVTSLTALFFASRRALGLAWVGALGITLVLLSAVSSLATVDWGSDGARVASEIARMAGWSPFGAAWTVPAAVAAGDAAGAVGKVAIALGFLGFLWLLWRALVAALLNIPAPPALVRRSIGWLGWFDRLPATPIGAVAARTLTYWARDNRYRASLVIVPIIPALLMVPLLVVGVPWSELVLIPVPVMCLFSAWLVHNDVAYDSSAFWLHVASNVTGRVDRIGRIAPMLVLGIPLVAVGCWLSTWLHGDWSVFPSLVGLSTCILLSGFGISSVFSARFPYPAVRPGDSPFQQPLATDTSPVLIQSLSFFSIVLLALPVAVMGAAGLLFGGGWHLAALITGIAIGFFALVLGVGIGAHLFNKRAPELLAFTVRN